MSTPAKKFPRWTTAAIVLAVLGNLIAAVVPVITLLQMPAGSSGRLMVEAFHDFIVSAITLLVVVIVAVVAGIKEKRWIALIIAVCLSLTPFFLSSWVMRVVAEARHIGLEP